MERIKTIFIGTSEFAVPILKQLLELNYIDLVAVITQPDRPAGRKQELSAPAVKKFLLEQNFKINVLQPEKVKKLGKKIREELQPELIIVASYGQIIPSKILNYPKFGALNIHASLLPDLRGAVPMQMALLNGYKKTGVTLQKMVFKMDEGDIISSREVPISHSDNFETLQDKCSAAAARMIREDLVNWIHGEIEAKPQDNLMATYCYTQDIAKDKAEITYETDVSLAERMSRAFYPWPIVWTRLKNGKVLKIYKASILNHDSNPELSLSKVNKELILNLKNGSLLLSEVQLEGKSRDLGKNYLWLV